MSETNGHLNGNGNGFHPNGKPKHAGGRPKKDHKAALPEGWVDIILAKSAEGYSGVEIRAHLCMMGGKFDHNSWYILQEKDQEFADTLKKGHVLCQAWWEKQSRINLKHDKADVFETGSWYANMKNRFGWRDKSEVEHSGNFTFTQLAANIGAANRMVEHGVSRSSAN